MTQKLFKNGYPFTDPMPKNIDCQISRVKVRDLPSLIIIDGGSGKGKSTLATHICDYINGFPTIWKKQYAMGGAEFQEKLQLSIDSGLYCVIYDEAGDFNRRGSLTEFNRSLNRIFDTCRVFKIIVILILPNFSSVDKHIFDNQIPRMLIHITRKHKDFSDFKVYGLHRMSWIKEFLGKAIVPEEAYRKEDPNFIGHFYNLDETRVDELKNISMYGKLELLNENIIKNKGFMCYGELAKKTGKSEIWVKKRIAELGAKEVTIFKRKKYYDSSILEELKVNPYVIA